MLSRWGQNPKFVFLLHVPLKGYGCSCNRSYRCFLCMHVKPPCHPLSRSSQVRLFAKEPVSWLGLLFKRAPHKRIRREKPIIGIRPSIIFLPGVLPTVFRSCVPVFRIFQTYYFICSGANTPQHPAKVRKLRVRPQVILPCLPTSPPQRIQWLVRIPWDG